MGKPNKELVVLSRYMQILMGVLHETIEDIERQCQGTKAAKKAGKCKIEIGAAQTYDELGRKELDEQGRKVVIGLLCDEAVNKRVDVGPTMYKANKTLALIDEQGGLHYNLTEATEKLKEEFTRKKEQGLITYTDHAPKPLEKSLSEVCDAVALIGQKRVVQTKYTSACEYALEHVPVRDNKGNERLLRDKEDKEDKEKRMTVSFCTEEKNKSMLLASLDYDAGKFQGLSDYDKASFTMDVTPIVKTLKTLVEKLPGKEFEHQEKILEGAIKALEQAMYQCSIGTREQTAGKRVVQQCSIGTREQTAGKRVVQQSREWTHDKELNNVLTKIYEAVNVAAGNGYQKLPAIQGCANNCLKSFEKLSETDSGTSSSAPKDVYLNALRELHDDLNNLGKTMEWGFLWCAIEANTGTLKKYITPSKEHPEEAKEGHHTECKSTAIGSEDGARQEVHEGTKFNKNHVKLSLPTTALTRKLRPQQDATAHDKPDTTACVSGVDRHEREGSVPLKQ